jgi:hypothetical protein
MLNYLELKEKPREFLVATGLRNEEFESLLPTFEKCYQESLPSRIASAANCFPVGLSLFLSPESVRRSSLFFSPFIALSFGGIF